MFSAASILGIGGELIGQEQADLMNHWALFEMDLGQGLSVCKVVVSACVCWCMIENQLTLNALIINRGSFEKGMFQMWTHVSDPGHLVSMHGDLMIT